MKKLHIILAAVTAIASLSASANAQSLLGQKAAAIDAVVVDLPSSNDVAFGFALTGNYPILANLDLHASYEATLIDSVADVYENTVKVGVNAWSKLGAEIPVSLYVSGDIGWDFGVVREGSNFRLPFDSSLIEGEVGAKLDVTRSFSVTPFGVATHYYNFNGETFTGYGVRAAYRLNESVTLRASTQTGETDAERYSIGASFRF